MRIAVHKIKQLLHHQCKQVQLTVKPVMLAALNFWQFNLLNYKVLLWIIIITVY